MTVSELFESRKNNPIWNTSYPLNPEDWAPYRITGPLPFQKDEQLSFYIHIPFCRQLCSFCEYTRMICPDEKAQNKYLRIIASDIEEFKCGHPDITLLGFDIGGGTPTSLSEAAFASLINIYQKAIEGLPLGAGYEPSIEGTFNTLSIPKLEAIANSGIARLSLGVQSSSCEVLQRHHRTGNDESKMLFWIQTASSLGIRKVNLDFMYGLNGQDVSSIDRDLEIISRLQPQQITLYEMRNNMVKSGMHYSKEDLYLQYSRYYKGLKSLGYVSRFGQNTFSKDPDDLGLSSYLRTRMINRASYKGFGLSAQSMSPSGLSYNIGKLDEHPEDSLNEKAFSERYTYILPPKEMAAKYLAISAYFGAFSKDNLTHLGVDDETFRERLDFCLANDLFCDSGDGLLHITPKGFMHYGAVFSLLYD